MVKIGVYKDNGTAMDPYQKHGMVNIHKPLYFYFKSGIVMVTGENTMNVPQYIDYGI